MNNLEFKQHFNEAAKLFDSLVDSHQKFIPQDQKQILKEVSVILKPLNFVITANLFKNSKLVKQFEEIQFLKECLIKPFKTKLLYQASIHGFTAKAFHEKCDNKGANITIVKSEHGLIFGGYTSLSWDMSNTWVIDNDNPFIFSLTKKTKHLNHSK